MVGYFFKTIQCMVLVIQCNINQIINLLLPILREPVSTDTDQGQQNEKAFSQKDGI